MHVDFIVVAPKLVERIVPLQLVDPKRDVTRYTLHEILLSPGSWFRLQSVVYLAVLLVLMQDCAAFNVGKWCLEQLTCQSLHSSA